MSKGRDVTLVGTECKCPQCGKVFIKPGDRWAYMVRVKTQWRCCCTWGCLRRWEAAHTISGQAMKGAADEQI